MQISVEHYYELQADKDDAEWKVTELVGVIDALCIELKKDNSIQARRKQVKRYRERVEMILSYKLHSMTASERQAFDGE